MIGGVIGAPIGASFPELHGYAPGADVSTAGWTDQAGGTTNLYATVDEPTPDDADYVKSPTLSSGNSSTLELAFGTLGTPPTDLDHVLRVRFRRQGSGPTMNFAFSLVQGTTVISTGNAAAVGTDWVVGELFLTEAEAASITNYSDLRVRLTASAV